MAGRRRAGRTAAGGKGAGRHRAAPRREPYRWLGAGAITFGLGVAVINGVGVAHADDVSSSPHESPAKAKDANSSRHAPHADSPSPPAAVTGSPADVPKAVPKDHGHDRANPAGDDEAQQPGAAPADAVSSVPSTDTRTGGRNGADQSAAPNHHAPPLKPNAKTPADQSNSGSTAAPTAPVGKPNIVVSTAAAPAPPTPATAAVRTTAPVQTSSASSAPQVVVSPTYTSTASITPATVLPPVVSAAPVTASPSTTPTSPVSVTPLALILGAAYQQSSSSNAPTTAPAASVTTSAPPASGTSAVVATIPVDPYAIALTPDGKTLYGTSSPFAIDASGMPTGTVQVVDASTNTQVGNPILVGQYLGTGNVVVNPTMNRAYVIAYNPYTITSPSGYNQTGVMPSLVVIDTTTNKVVGTAVSLVKSDQNSVTTIYPGPSPLAVSADGSRLYVAGATVTSTYAGQVLDWRPAVTVFDTKTNTQVGDPIVVGPPSTNLYSGTGAASVLVSPDGKRLYVTTVSNLASNGSAAPAVTATIYTVDSKSGAPIGNPIVMANDAGALIPQTEALSPDGTKLYVESISYPGITIGQNSQALSAQDIANGTVLTYSTSTGKQIGGPINVVGYGVMTLSPDGKTLYVSDVADSRTGKKASYQPYPGSSSQTLYEGSVTGYNLATGRSVGTPTTVGLAPTSMAINSAGTRLYVANMADNTISVIKITSTSSGTPNLLQSFVIGVQAWSANFATAGQQFVSGIAAWSGQLGRTVQAGLGNVVHTTQSAINTVLDQVKAVGSAIVDVLNLFPVTHAVLDVVGINPKKPTISPTTAQGLYERLRSKTDTASGIWVDKVVNNGKTSYVVYLGGTQTSIDRAVQQNLQNNIGAVQGNLKAGQSVAIEKAIHAAGGNPNAPIMLVGFSQGGIDAQNIAKYEPQFHVTSVVLYAAPLLYSSPTGNFTQVDLVANDDPIPGLTPAQQISQQLHGHVYGPAIPSDFWSYEAARTAARVIPGVGSGAAALIGLQYHGDIQTYSSVGSQFDKDNGYRDIKSSIASFSGTVAQSWS